MKRQADINQQQTKLNVVGQVWPGSHNDGVKRRMRLQVGLLELCLSGEAVPQEDGTTAFDRQPSPRELGAGAGNYVYVPVRAGDAVLLHGSLWHKSGANTSDAPRRAYTMHVVDGACTYAKENWLQRENIPFREMQPS